MDLRTKVVSTVSAGVLLISLTVGCAAQRPRTFAYPAKNQTLEQTINDEAYCEAWAKRKTGAGSDRVVSEGGKGAVLGTLAGLAIGLIVGKPLKGVAIGAGSGAAAGGLYGNKVSQDDLDKAYGACMEARGYIVK